MKTLAYILEKYKIYDNLPRKMPVEIPDTTRLDLAKLFAELGFTRGAEIGVRTGIYSEMLCQVNPGLKLYCVDPWDVEAYFEHGEKSIPGDGIATDQETHEGYYREAQERLSPYSCTLIRHKSLEAVKFCDEMLDFVYIDGNHDFQNCTNDIVEWSLRVRPGGIIAGHDYTRFRASMRVHTLWVVNAYTAALGIRPWFVLGQDEKSGDNPRDDIRSWFWVKHED